MDVNKESSSSSSNDNQQNASSRLSTTSIQQQNETQLTVQTIKEYLQSKGGKCKYSDIFDHFREPLSDQKTNEQFHGILAKIADKKCDNDNKYLQEEWSLKKKYNTNSNDTTIQSPNATSSATSFFAHTLQKTRKNLNKIEHRLTTAFNPKTIMNQQQHQSSTNINKNDDLTKTELTTSTTLNPTILITTTSVTTVGDNYNETKENEQPQQDRNIKSVKEHAKKLNRLNTESELKRAAALQTSPSSPSIMSNQNKYKPKTNASNAKNIELESFDVSNLKPHEKEWLLVCSKADSYMDIAKILSKNPELAQKKDPFNTCAHWGCKHGNIEIIKLLASTLENDTKTNPKSIRIQHLINSRTGYTCLHIAYIFTHTELVSTLNQYGGQNLIDYSGKLGIEYSLGSNDFIVIDAAERKPTLLDFTNERNSHNHNEESSNFIFKVKNYANALIKRSGTIMHTKDKRVSSSMLYMDPANSKETDNSEDSESNSRRNTLRPGSTRTTPSASPARSIDTTVSNDSQIMPPPKTNIIPRSKQTPSSLTSSFEDLANTTCSQSTTSMDDIKSIGSEEKKE